jgi:hypothetical protein
MDQTHGRYREGAPIMREDSIVSNRFRRERCIRIWIGVSCEQKSIRQGPPLFDGEPALAHGDHE